jgi:hypothetical protein
MDLIFGEYKNGGRMFRKGRRDGRFGFVPFVPVLEKSCEDRKRIKGHFRKCTSSSCCEYACSNSLVPSDSS